MTPCTADALPLDLWAAVGAHLRQRDLAALACASRSMRDATRLALLQRDALRVRHDRAGEVAARYPDARGLDVRGLPRRYGKAVTEALGLLRLPASMPHLRRLDLHHPRLAPGFWPAVFAACPRLDRVSFVGDFFMSNYSDDVEHVLQLLTHGAPRLRELDIEGGWLVLARVNEVTAAEDPRLARLVRLAADTPPVASTTLRRLRHACRQVPVGVDAPGLVDLEVDEQYERPLVLGGRMGPRTLASVTSLTWRGYWPAFDAAALAPMAALARADIAVVSASTPRRMAECLRTLEGLPRGLRSLRLDLDIWLMRAANSAIPWPEHALAHLKHLEHLELSMLFPPSSCDRLLGTWLGAGAAIRTAVLRFRQPATRGIEDEIARLRVDLEATSDDEAVLHLHDMLEEAGQSVDGGLLEAWLDARPATTATIHNFPALACSHPRCHLMCEC